MTEDVVPVGPEDCGRGKCLALTMLLFGSIGGITWAIRGTGGWGGMDGTLVPGMTWGLLWYYVSRRMGVDGRGISFWLGFGIALGGMLGYGQYISWIRGMFNVKDEIIPVARWIGFLWLAVTGLGWGAPGGIALGWAIGRGTGLKGWLARLFVPLIVAFLGWILVQTCPVLFFPNHDLGIYGEELGRHLQRTVSTNTTNAVTAFWWIGAMIVAGLQRDRRTLIAGGVISGGFFFAFPLSAAWCLGYEHAPQYIDWWKVWELSSGFFMGALYALMLFWWMKPKHRPEEPSPLPVRVDKRRAVSITMCVSTLLLITFFGVTSRAGVVLGLYDDKAVDQYQWPLPRIILFAPLALAILGGMTARLWQILRHVGGTPLDQAREPALSHRVGDVMMLMGLVGAITIWPHKIGVLYAFFLLWAIFAFNRLRSRTASSVPEG